jgi:hypothetical protein
MNGKSHWFGRRENHRLSIPDEISQRIRVSSPCPPSQQPLPRVSRTGLRPPEYGRGFRHHRVGYSDRRRGADPVISHEGSGRDRYFTWVPRRFWTNDTTSEGFGRTIPCPKPSDVVSFVNKEKARLSHQPSRLPKRRAAARTVNAHRPATQPSPAAQIHTQRGCWPN